MVFSLGESGRERRREQRLNDEEHQRGPEEQAGEIPALPEHRYRLADIIGRRHPSRLKTFVSRRYIAGRDL